MWTKLCKKEDLVKINTSISTAGWSSNKVYTAKPKVRSSRPNEEVSFLEIIAQVILD